MSQSRSGRLCAVFAGDGRQVVAMYVGIRDVGDSDAVQ
jgi:hypothetical protein